MSTQYQSPKKGISLNLGRDFSIKSLFRLYVTTGALLSYKESRYHLENIFCC